MCHGKRTKKEKNGASHRDTKDKKIQHTTEQNLVEGGGVRGQGWGVNKIAQPPGQPRRDEGELDRLVMTCMKKSKKELGERGIWPLGGG